MLFNVFSNYGPWESDMIGHIMVGQAPSMNLADLKPVVIECWKQQYPNKPFPDNAYFELTTDQDRIEDIYEEEELSVYVANDFTCVVTVAPGDGTLMFVGFVII